jgi:hypothetical protein
LKASQQFILEIFLLNFMQNRKSNKRKNKILRSLDKSLQQVNQIEKGKLKPLSLKQLLDEL